MIDIRKKLLARDKDLIVWMFISQNQKFPLFLSPFLLLSVPEILRASPNTLHANYRKLLVYWLQVVRPHYLPSHVAERSRFLSTIKPPAKTKLDDTAH